MDELFCFFSNSSKLYYLPSNSDIFQTLVGILFIKGPI